MTNSEIISNAITTKMVIVFNYDGYQRVVEPYTIGIHADTGNLVLSAYRVGGYSKSNTSPPWRLYDVSLISSLTITSTPSSSTFRNGYNPRDSRMSRIINTR